MQCAVNGAAMPLEAGLELCHVVLGQQQRSRSTVKLCRIRVCIVYNAAGLPGERDSAVLHEQAGANGLGLIFCSSPRCLAMSLLWTCIAPEL